MISMFELKFFAKSNKGISASDFTNKEKSVLINLNSILSISTLDTYSTPFSESQVGEYSFITMINNDVYYIKKESYNKLLNVISKIG